MRRLLLVVGVALVVLLAGCAGVPSGDTEIDDDRADVDGDEPDDETTDEETDDETTADETDDETTDEETDDETTADETDDETTADETDDETTDDKTADETTDEETDDETNEPSDVDGELELHHIDVGQADATLIITPAGETILIDTGDWRQSGEGVIEYLEAHDIDRVDHLVATHGHADHIGGHDEIIKWAETEGDGIGTAYDSGVSHTSQTYERYLDAVEEYDIELLTVKEGDELPIAGEVTGLVLNPPTGDLGTDLHDNSVALAIEFGEFRYVTTGDAETAAEQRMVEHWSADLDADVYHAGHHGSSTSSTDPFLDAVAPEIAIISSAYDSQYGHPHDEVLTAFGERDIETYWTGVHGDIVLSTDGNGSISATTSEDFSTDPDDLLDEKPTDDTASLVVPGGAAQLHSEATA